MENSISETNVNHFQTLLNDFKNLSWWKKLLFPPALKKALRQSHNDNINIVNIIIAFLQNSWWFPRYFFKSIKNFANATTLHREVYSIVKIAIASETSTINAVNNTLNNVLNILDNQLKTPNVENIDENGMFAIAKQCILELVRTQKDIQVNTDGYQKLEEAFNTLISLSMFSYIQENSKSIREFIQSMMKKPFGFGSIYDLLSMENPLAIANILHGMYNNNNNNNNIYQYKLDFPMMYLSQNPESLKILESAKKPMDLGKALMILDDNRLGLLRHGEIVKESRSTLENLLNSDDPIRCAEQMMIVHASNRALTRNGSDAIPIHDAQTSYGQTSTPATSAATPAQGNGFFNQQPPAFKLFEVSDDDDDQKDWTSGAKL